jgi:hypothetical protein
MKSTYEQRWGHKRTRKATKHLEVKAQKRVEAEERQLSYDQQQAEHLGVSLKQYRMMK